MYVCIFFGKFERTEFCNVKLGKQTFREESEKIYYNSVKSLDYLFLNLEYSREKFSVYFS